MLVALILLFLVILYVQVGYPALMWGLAKFFPRKVSVTDLTPDAISIILCVHNGAATVAARLQNLASCQWDGVREILVYCDGCTDDTALKAETAGVEGVRIISSKLKLGKWSALNESVGEAQHPIIIFADLRQTFESKALKELVDSFQDRLVGAVSGRLEIATSTSSQGQGVDLYWKMERKLREWEGRFDSVIGCTGAIYAIRKKAFLPLEPGTILDDVIVPMKIAVAGWLVAYNPKAIAYDPQSLDPLSEKSRKLRTLVGNYQMLERHPRWLLPGHNRLWWQFISHKHARLAMPWLILSSLVLSVTAAKTLFVWFLLGAQILCCTLAATGWLIPTCRSKIVTIPAGYLLLQLTCARAFFAYLKSRRNPLSLWQTSNASQPSSRDSK
ncbi:MAG: glycosyltransferase [Prosthecobacter sp.]